MITQKSKQARARKGQSAISGEHAVSLPRFSLGAFSIILFACRWESRRKQT